ncbi:MAG: 50S ribosomal protein L31e [Candidatus Methanospirareceae archaeon]
MASEEGISKEREYVYTIPLRKVKRAPRWERSRKAMAEIRAFLKRHTKADAVILDTAINEKVWERGSQKPPSKIRVRVKKEMEEDMVVARAELVE